MGTICPNIIPELIWLNKYGPSVDLEVVTCICSRPFSVRNAWCINDLPIPASGEATPPPTHGRHSYSVCLFGLRSGP